MQRAMIKCNGVQTDVITEGRWVEEGLAPGGNKDVILVIPGNPGVPSFYEDFIKSLNSKLPSEVPIWLIGHAGHVEPPENLRFSLPGDTLDKHRYDLKGQIEHKAKFIRKYVPEDARLHLIGHSIGCWFILNLLKDDSIANRVVKCYLLFPTVERMADSPNGKFFVNFIQRIASLLVFFSWIFAFFPLFLQVFLIRVFGIFYGIPKKRTKAVLQLLNPAALEKVIMLAIQEMAQVREADHDIISEHADKLWFYYGSKDGWTPIEYYEEMKSKHPNVKIELCKRGFYHSFVLGNDKEMGHLIGDIVNENIY